MFLLEGDALLLELLRDFARVDQEVMRREQDREAEPELRRVTPEPAYELVEELPVLLFVGRQHALMPHGNCQHAQVVGQGQAWRDLGLARLPDFERTQRTLKERLRFVEAGEQRTETTQQHGHGQNGI